MSDTNAQKNMPTGNMKLQCSRESNCTEIKFKDTEDCDQTEFKIAVINKVKEISERQFSELKRKMYLNKAQTKRKLRKT